jgi:hypothetical protein
MEMSRQNRVAFVVTGLTAFLLGAGSYWLAFDRGSTPPPSVAAATPSVQRPDRDRNAPREDVRPAKPVRKEPPVERVNRPRRPESKKPTRYTRPRRERTKPREVKQTAPAPAG